MYKSTSKRYGGAHSSGFSKSWSSGNVPKKMRKKYTAKQGYYSTCETFVYLGIDPNDKKQTFPFYLAAKELGIKPIKKTINGIKYKMYKKEKVKKIEEYLNDYQEGW